MSDDAKVQAIRAIRKQRIDSAHYALRRLRDGISPHPLADVEEVALLLNDANAALADAERERDAAVAALRPARALLAQCWSLLAHIEANPLPVPRAELKALLDDLQAWNVQDNDAPADDA